MSNESVLLLRRALINLKGASRMLTEDCKSALNGKQWCGGLIKDIEDYFQKEALQND